ncbi:hypothetical protein [Streptomyces sundarbansensis]
MKMKKEIISSPQILLKRFSKLGLKNQSSSKQLNESLGDLEEMETLEDKDSSMEVEELFLDEEDSEIGNGRKPQPAVSHQPTNSLNPATEHSISSEAKYRKISEKTTENSENTKKSRNNSPLLHTRGWDSTRK